MYIILLYGALINLKSQKNVGDKRLISPTNSLREQDHDLGFLPRLNTEYSPVQRFFMKSSGYG